MEESGGTGHYLLPRNAGVSTRALCAHRKQEPATTSFFGGLPIYSWALVRLDLRKGLHTRRTMKVDLSFGHVFESGISKLHFERKRIPKSGDDTRRTVQVDLTFGRVFKSDNYIVSIQLFDRIRMTGYDSL